MFSYTMGMLVHLTHLVLSYGTLSNEIFCGSFLIKNLAIFLRATTVKQLLFLNHRNRILVGYKHNILVYYVYIRAPNLFGVVLQPFYMRIFVVHFLSNILLLLFCACHNRKINFIPQPQKHKSCRSQTQCSNILCGCLCT